MTATLQIWYTGCRWVTPHGSDFILKRSQVKVTTLEIVSSWFVKVLRGVNDDDLCHDNSEMFGIAVKMMAIRPHRM